MNKKILAFITGFLPSLIMSGQSTGQPGKPPASSKFSNALSLGLSIPLGAFNQSHSTGVSIDYFRSDKRFGDNKETYPLLKFAMNGLFSINPGRTETVAGYPFQYGTYMTLSTMAGVDCKPADPLHISLLAGPVMSLYKSSVEVGGGVNLFSTYYISRIISVGPGVSYKKFSKTDGLWSATLRASYCF
jgi:hypothetical protein